MATPVQITVTVDSNGAVTGFQQIGGAATTMGQEVSTSGLKGQAAIDALTKQWNAEQAAIAAVNARIKENMAAHTASNDAAAKAIKAAQDAAKADLAFRNAAFASSARAYDQAAKQFQGFTTRQQEASVSGRLLEQTLGLQNRALNQVVSRSALLGPLMAAAFPIAIATAFVPMLLHVGDAIAKAAQEAGGMTEEMKQLNQETLQANQQDFLHPKTIDQAQVNLNNINKQIEANEALNKIVAEGSLEVYQKQTFMQQIMSENAFMSVQEIASNGEKDKGVQLLKEQKTLLESQAELIRQAAVDQAVISAEGSGLHGFQKINFDEAAAIKHIEDDKSLDAVRRAEKEYSVHYEFSQKRLELEQGETDKTIALRQQVVDETLHGTAKILADEAAAVDQLTRMQQRSGGDRAQFEQQKVLIHQRALNQIAAQDAAGDQYVKDLQERAVASALTGDDAIIASGQKEKEAAGRRWAEKLLTDQQYNAAVRAIDQETNNKIQANDQNTTDKHAEELAKTKAMQDRADEDMRTAQEDAALAAVPEWQRASAQIEIELNRRERAIEDQKIKELAAEHLTQDQIVAINQDADAKRYDAIVQTNMRIQEENKRMVEQFGGDLQSVFDDMTSGNIGKRILSNMEKLFFQIVAQWILSLNVMKSAAGSIFGSIVFGPGSTGANVFGGGSGGGGPLSILGSLFGGSGSSAPSGAAFQPGGIFSDPSTFAGGTAPIFAAQGGLSGAIAGTGAAPGAGLLPSASNALTSATMSDALVGIGGGTSSVAGSAGKAGGISSLFSGGNLASLGGLGLATAGSAFGGKSGQAGALLMGLLMSGKLAPVLSSMFGAIGLGATGAIAGGLTGGLIGFGVGQGHGGLLGSLAGAGSGALTGFLVGGPVGALVGGIVGLLGGIFGGIFGGSKRKKQANALADNTLIPDITQISNGFDGFQIDSSSAIQQLEQLRTDSQKQLSALKGQGNDVFNLKVTPAINAAEQHIRDTQAERDRRSAQVFGPPQFDTGGMFSVQRGNAGLAVLHHGEVVINPDASKKNLSTLARINAGGSVGSGTQINLTINAMDAKSFDDWARRGGAEMLKRAMDRHTVEGH
jgi:hypothetical protein